MTTQVRFEVLQTTRLGILYHFIVCIYHLICTITLEFSQNDEQGRVKWMICCIPSSKKAVQVFQFESDFLLRASLTRQREASVYRRSIAQAGTLRNARIHVHVLEGKVVRKETIVCLLCVWVCVCVSVCWFVLAHRCVRVLPRVNTHKLAWMHDSEGNGYIRALRRD